MALHFQMNTLGRCTRRLCGGPIQNTVAVMSWSSPSMPRYRQLHSSRLCRLETEKPISTNGPSSSIPPPLPSHSHLPANSSTNTSQRQRESSTPSSNSNQGSPFSAGSTSQTPMTPPEVDAQITKRRITRVDQLPKTFGRNQFIHVSEEVQKDLEDVLRTFQAPIRFAFAYGSGVFRQDGYTSKDKPLLDFVFAVSHPSHWHAINMQQHPGHYSLPMRLLGSDAVAWMQEKGLGANVWFNVEVEVNGKIVKYGCISVDALCRDMLDWETLYISGRTQKPVRILADDARVKLANQVNLASAVRTALLLLPDEFNEIQLFEEIAGLSYRGDFRMKVGENPLKVRNIVGAQLDAFRSLYGGLLKSFWKTVYVIGENPIGGRSVRIMRQDKSSKTQANLAGKLPIGLKGKIMTHYERAWNLKTAMGEKGEVAELSDLDQAQLWERIVEDKEFKSMIDKSLSEIVGRPTFNQSLKGILSAGPLKSLRYIGPKLRKKWLAPSPAALESPSPTSAETEKKA